MIPYFGNQLQWIDEDGYEMGERKHVHDSQDPAGPPQILAPKSRGSYSKYWCFTSFKDDAPRFSDEVSYGIYQQEQCPATGRKHWQGYVEFTTKKRLNCVQSAIGDDAAHCELRKGTRQQAIAYCKKVDSRVPGTEPTEHGDEPGGEESKSQLANVAKRIEAGAKFSEICAEFPTAIMRYDKGIRTLLQNRDAQEPLSFRPIKVITLTGPPGCGKTRWAFEYATKFFNGFAYSKTYSEGQASWWDGYIDQQCIIIDDFEGTAPIEELLHLLGGYGHCRNWPIKGGFIRLGHVKTIIFTSNSKPQEWYWGRRNFPAAKIEALMRRITEQIVYVDQDTFTFNRNEP